MKSAAFFSIFVLCFANVVFAQDINNGTITGQLMIKGGFPLAGGQVFFFNDASGPPPSQVSYWRVPDYRAQIDEAGRFSIQLPAGKYYLGALKRMSGEKIGPPAKGDYFFAGADEQGLPRSYVVKKGETTELGVISEAAPFQKKDATPGTEITAIEGTVFTAEGKAVEGALVLAQVMPLSAGRHPLFASERTGKDGHYILKVSDSGHYYLRVRSMHDMVPPAAGELIGAYGGKEPVPIAINKGQVIKGMDITVIRFTGRGGKGKSPRGSGPQENQRANIKYQERKAPGGE